MQAEEIWNLALPKLKDRMPGRYESFIKAFVPIDFNGQILTLQTPMGYLPVFANSDRPTIEQSVYEAANGARIQVNFSMAEARSVLETVPAPPPNLEFTPPRGTQPLAAHAAVGILNPKYTFDSFVVGNHGKFAHAAAWAVANNPGKAYNPLFIHGGVGLGKTHLMHAIGHLLLLANPRAKVAYVSTEKFTNEVINGIRTESMNDLRTRYRSIDLLLIDDIQFIERTTATQEEFFHTFNALHEAGKQLVIVSDRPPKQLTHLEDRLRNRFEWGLQTDIQAPDLETRIAILRKKAEQDGFEVPDEVLDFIAGAYHDNVRELEGAFIRVMAFASLNGSKPTLDSAQHILGTANVKPVTMERIATVIADHFNVSLEDLQSPKRNKEYTQPRHIACYLIREMTGSSFQAIGRFFDRDHTSIMHGINKVKGEIALDMTKAASMMHLKGRIMQSS